jgi:hypothetical protein
MDMKKWHLGIAGASLVAAVAIVGGFLSDLNSVNASSGTYNFTIRGIVMAVDKTAKTVTVSVTHTSPAATADLAGVSQEFNVSPARFYNYNAALKKVRVTLGNVPIGNEVVLQGAKRGEGRFNVSLLTVNPNAFSIVGYVQDQNTTDKTITVQVTSSTYKEAAIKGNNVVMYYGGSTTFRNAQLKDINADELDAHQERAKLTGIVTNGSKYEVQAVIDGYAKAK